MRHVQTAILAVLGTMLLTAAVSAQDGPIDTLPMYGGKHKPTVPENKEASRTAAELGWEFYRKGDLDTAMKRFNQAWMFNRRNAEAYWGFGLIMARRADETRPEHHLKESIRLLETAVARARKNARVLTDLALSHIHLGRYYARQSNPKSKKQFAKAASVLKKAERLDPKYPLLHFNRSLLEFYQGNYAQAKTHLDRAKALGYKPDPAYESDLGAKL